MWTNVSYVKKLVVVWLKNLDRKVYTHWFSNASGGNNHYVHKKCRKTYTAPQTNEAVYSAMTFVDRQSRLVGQCCAQLTFDQPLCLKAYKIKEDTGQDFVQLCFGGFH